MQTNNFNSIADLGGGNVCPKGNLAMVVSIVKKFLYYECRPKIQKKGVISNFQAGGLLLREFLYSWA